MLRNPYLTSQAQITHFCYKINQIKNNFKLTTCLLFLNSSNVFFFGMTSEFLLLVKDAIIRVRKCVNSDAELYSGFEVRINARVYTKKN